MDLPDGRYEHALTYSPPTRSASPLVNVVCIAK